MSISIDGLNDLIKYLKAYRKSIPEREKLCLKLLAEIGINEASVRFKTAQYDGVNDVMMTGPKWIDSNKIAIYAVGNAVAFIEFGTGITYSEQHPKADEFGMQRGQFGKGKGKQQAWGYYGVGGSYGEYIKTTPKGDVYLTYGNPPNAVMYETGKVIEQQILSIVKQVFSFD